MRAAGGPEPETAVPTTTFAEFAQQADYSLLEALQPDPQATLDGDDHQPRQVFSGHYVPVTPSPLPGPHYVGHSSSLFAELGDPPLPLTQLDRDNAKHGDRSDQGKNHDRHGPRVFNQPAAYFRALGKAIAVQIMARLQCCIRSDGFPVCQGNR